MNNYGILSLLPIAVMLIIAFKFKNVFLALLSSIFVITVIVGFKTDDFLVGAESIASVFTSVSTAKTTFFVLLTGAIMKVVNVSGGVEGLIYSCTEKQKIVNNRVTAQLISFVLGLLLFVDATSSIVVTALVGKPFFSKYNVPKEKLALISNSTGSAVAWIIPFGGACAFLTGVLAVTLEAAGSTQDAFTVVMSSVMFQFYNIVLLIIILISILLGREVGGIKKITEDETIESDDYQYETNIPGNKKPLARNLIIPLTTLIVTIFTLLFTTGSGNIMQGDGATAVFTGGIITIILTGILYIVQKIVTLDGYIKWCFEGIKGMIEISVILILAFAFGNMLSLIGTADYIATFTEYIPLSIILVASLIFAVLISYSTGSSGATVVLLVPITVPIAIDLGIPIPYILGAIVSGAVFGDQNSPISDSVILTSTSTGVDVMTHVKTQLPYTTIALGLALIIFLLLGFTI